MKNYSACVTQTSILNRGNRKLQRQYTASRSNCCVKLTDFSPGTFLLDVILAWNGPTEWSKYDILLVQLGTEV